MSRVLASPVGRPSFPARLQQSLAALDAATGAALAGPERLLPLGLPAVDAVLGGGLAAGALHELSSEGPDHFGATLGFAAALAGRTGRGEGETLWIAPDFAGLETGRLYAPGLAGFGLPPSQLLMLRLSRPAEVMWAMEEGLRCRALAAVVAEVTGEIADELTVTRRLSLAARRHEGFGFLVRHRVSGTPNAAATRWRVAAAPGVPDRFGGLGAAAFVLSLVKNRRGSSGRWIVTWNCHDRVFQPAVSLGVAEAAFDRSHRPPLGRTA